MKSAHFVVGIVQDDTSGWWYAEVFNVAGVLVHTTPMKPTALRARTAVKRWMDGQQEVEETEKRLAQAD